MNTDTKVHIAKDVKYNFGDAWTTICGAYEGTHWGLRVACRNADDNTYDTLPTCEACILLAMAEPATVFVYSRCKCDMV
jgi:hypothetical protein